MSPQSTSILEDLNLLIVKDSLPENFDLEDIKTKLSKITTLNVDDVFNPMSNIQIEQLNERQLSKYTHVVSETVDFPNYELITRKLLTPVTTVEWINELFKQMKIVPVRSFSPDTRLIFKDVVCLCGSTEDDQDIVKTAINIFGGIYTKQIRKHITHFITDDPTHKHVKLLQEYNKVNRDGVFVNIVRSSWLFDSIMAAKCQDESKYGLDRPAVIQSQRPEYLKDINIIYSSKLKLSGQMDIALKELTNNSADCTLCIERFVDTAIPANVMTRSFDYLFTLLLYKSDRLEYDSLLFYPVREIPILGMHRLRVATTNYTGGSRLYIEELIQRIGGFFTKTLRPDNTHLVSAKDMGKKMEYAGKWNVAVVNHVWVEDCFVNWKLLSGEDYTELLRPDDSTRLINDVKFDGFKVDQITREGSVSALDAEFALDNKSTSPIKNKTKALPIQEVEKTFADNEVLPETQLSQTENVIELVKEMNGMEPEVVEQQTKSIKKSTKKQKVVQEKKKPELSSKETTKSINLDDNASISNGDDVWQIPDDLTVNKTSADVVEISDVSKKRQPAGRSKSGTDTNGSMVEISDTNSKRSSSVALTETEEVKEPSKKIAKPNNKPYNIVAIVTGFDGTLSPADKRELRKVGIDIIENPNKNLNSVIAPSILRTQKFLTALAYDPTHFLEPLFLTDVLGTLDSVKKIGDFDSLAPKLEKYDLWNHANYEKEIVPKRLFSKGTTKTEAWEHMKKNRSGLFKNFAFNVSPGLPAGFDTLKVILKSYGCKTCLQFSKGSKTVSAVNDGPTVNKVSNVAILVCGIDEVATLNQFSKVCSEKGLNYVAVTWDSIVTAIFEAGLTVNDDNYILQHGVCS